MVGLIFVHVPHGVVQHSSAQPSELSTTVARWQHHKHCPGITYVVAIQYEIVPGTKLLKLRDWLALGSLMQPTRDDWQPMSERVCRIQHSTRHRIGYFGDKSFQAINCTGIDKLILKQFICRNCWYQCAYDCAQLCYIIQHRTVLIVFPLIPQTVTIAQIKERKSIYRALFYQASQSAQTRITQFYLQITPCLPVLRKHSPDVATPTEVADI